MLTVIRDKLSAFYDNEFTGALLSESFALEPLDATAMAMAGMEKTKPKRKRRLIIDEQKNISGDEMKANMADYRYSLLILNVKCFEDL